jgi:hypothetical protein
MATQTAQVNAHSMGAAARAAGHKYSVCPFKPKHLADFGNPREGEGASGIAWQRREWFKGFNGQAASH